MALEARVLLGDVHVTLTLNLTCVRPTLTVNVFGSHEGAAALVLRANAIPPPPLSLSQFSLPSHPAMAPPPPPPPAEPPAAPPLACPVGGAVLVAAADLECQVRFDNLIGTTPPWDVNQVQIAFEVGRADRAFIRTGQSNRTCLRVKWEQQRVPGQAEYGAVILTNGTNDAPYCVQSKEAFSVEVARYGSKAVVGRLIVFPVCLRPYLLGASVVGDPQWKG